MSAPTTYREFVRQLEARPADQSPLRWLASLGPNRPPITSYWVLRWVREQREAGRSREGAGETDE